MKPFSRYTTIVVRFFTIKLNPQLQPQQVRILLVHYAVERIFVYVLPTRAYQVLVTGIVLKNVRMNFLVSKASVVIESERVRLDLRMMR